MFEDDKEETVPNQNGKSQTPMLDNFGVNLNQMYIDGKFDKVVGRDKEVDRIIQILSRRKKNNPIIIGEPGCVSEDTLITVRLIQNTENYNHTIHEI